MDASRTAHAPLPDLRLDQQYWLVQLLFWSLFLFFNLFMAVLFPPVQAISITVPTLLSTFLLFATHGLHRLYQHRAASWPLYKVLGNTVWILPLCALLAQLAMFFVITGLQRYLPTATAGMTPYKVGWFALYALNTTVILVIWSTVYLLFVHYRRSRQVETAYWRSQALLHDTELQFLHSQINSHFLFNAMNNLRALIREDPELARERLTQLASLLRAVLQANNKDRISLQEELALVEAYLALESLQYERRLRVIWSVDEQVKAIGIPPMLVQTLVENSVRHGIAQVPGGGDIEIEAKLLDEEVVIRIRNPVNAASQAGGQGIGLKNARRRLSALFRDKASLRLSQDNNTMTAELRLPS
ncbi:MAG: histidine kinase [Cellvibrionaceae bacterium]